MSEYNLATPVALPPRQSHLGRDLVIDIILILIAVLLISIAIPAVFLALYAMQQGIGLKELQGLQQNQLLKILGVPGILVLLVVQNLLFVLVPIARVVWLRHEPLATLGVTLAKPLRDIGLGVGLGVIILICNAAIGAAFVSFGLRQNQSAEYPLFAGDYIGQLGFFIGAAIIVPIGEEMLFRGYLFTTLSRIWSTKSWGRVAMFAISALIFSLAHAAAASQDVIALLVPAFVMGLLLAYGMYRTGSIVPGIIAHAMNNGLALTALIACINNPGICPNI